MRSRSANSGSGRRSANRRVVSSPLAALAAAGAKFDSEHPSTLLPDRVLQRMVGAHDVIPTTPAQSSAPASRRAPAPCACGFRRDSGDKQIATGRRPANACRRGRKAGTRCRTAESGVARHIGGCRNQTAPARTRDALTEYQRRVHGCASAGCSCGPRGARDGEARGAPCKRCLAAAPCRGCPSRARDATRAPSPGAPA